MRALSEILAEVNSRSGHSKKSAVVDNGKKLERWEIHLIIVALEDYAKAAGLGKDYYSELIAKLSK